MMRAIRTIACLSIALAGIGTGHALAADVVSEQFTDGDRTTQSPPSSLQWTSGAHNNTADDAFTTLSVVGGKLIWDHTGANGASFSTIWGHFTSGGSPLTLNTGQTLRLTFDVSFSNGVFGNSANTFRFQLFNSDNSRTTTDFAGSNETGVSSGSTFSTWRGYEVTLPAVGSANTGSDMILRERTGTGPGLSTSANWISLAGSSVAEPLLTAGATYPGILEITRTASGVDVRGGIAGVSTPLISDNSSPVTSFDTIAFFMTDALTHDATLDNIVLSVVPEPASALLLLPGAVLLASRRRCPRP